MKMSEHDSINDAAAAAAQDKELQLSQTEEEEEEPYIYTSIRYDPIFKTSPENTSASFNTPCPFYMLEHHWTRLQIATWSAQFWPDGAPPTFPGKPADFLRALLAEVRHWQRTHSKEAEWAEALRIRRRAYASGRVTTEIWQIPRKPLSCFFPSSFDLPPGAAPEESEWSVVPDHQPTAPTEATMFKIWDRAPQRRARADAGIYALGTPKEVLLYNHDHEVLDGSSFTAYFHRDGRWVTPASSSGGLQGTTRRWALEKGLCSEGVVSIGSCKDGDTVWISNAVRGYIPAVFRDRDPNLKPPSAAHYQYVRQQLS